MDERILAKPAQHFPADLAHEGHEVQRNCFYSLEGGEFLGYIGHDGQEVVEAIRCRRCKAPAG